MRREEPLDRLDSAFVTGATRRDTAGLFMEGEGHKPPGIDCQRKKQVVWDPAVVGGETTSAHPVPDRDEGTIFWTESDVDAWETWDERPSIHVDASIQFKLYLFYTLILADILVDAFTEPLRTDDIVIHVLTFSFQIFVKLATLMAFCLLTTETVYIKMALYGDYFNEFQAIFLTAMVAFAVFFGVRGWNLFMIYDGVPPMAMWTMHGNLYTGLYTTSRLVNVVYYGVLVTSAHVACSERLYTAECLRR